MITISTRSRYATRIMLYLAALPPGARAKKQEISDFEEISPDYVEQILLRLKDRGLARSYRGVNGGFTIASGARQKSVADVLEAVDGPIALAPCLKSDCDRGSMCVTKTVWEEASELLENFFSEKQLGTLAEKARTLRHSNVHNYQI